MVLSRDYSDHMRVITSFDDLDPVPWVNGAGETTELVSLAGSQALTPDRLRWRLSIARLDRPAEFSPLPGLARTFLPIGAEVVLEIDEQVQSVTPAAPARFRGEQKVSLVGLEDPCFALNLMVEVDDAAGAGTGAGTGAGGERDALEMSTRFTGRGLFAVSLNSVPGYARFQLLRLDEAEVLPDHFDAAVLH
ncbi:HutD protein [Brevibacterium sandarakinum]|uniref:HutD protein n=2 Tax=Brevibacterium sandarakinum TaxID=629680 RepID=A0A1H1P7W0_BRESA|nr:HutD protein [Brevibacterium sandarakinum]